MCDKVCFSVLACWRCLRLSIRSELWCFLFAPRGACLSSGVARSERRLSCKGRQIVALGGEGGRDVDLGVASQRNGS